MGWQTLADLSPGNTLTAEHMDEINDAVAELSMGAVTFIFDGGGADIQDNVRLVIPYFPFKMDIQAVTLMSEETGLASDAEMEVDIYVGAGSDTLDSDDSICAAALPTLTGDSDGTGDFFYRDTTLTGWTSGVAQGNAIIAIVLSCTDITKAYLTINWARSS
ncbi:MAG: hypothetical protein ACW98K_17845 [Candidatus Kariarchaeaceae archaeon]|jgi:hypothetical protein